jgi:LPPG:FO 2-phospho-L-lactate transferase
MLAIPGLRSALLASKAPVIAVSPIIGGQAVKGPTAKMMKELGLQVDATAVAAHYGELIDGFVIDSADAGFAQDIEVAVDVRPILMCDQADRETLARAVLDFADRLACVHGRTR